NLRNGQVGVTFAIPNNACVGDLIPVEVQVTDPSRTEPFVCKFKIRVVEPTKDKESGDSDKPQKRGASRLAMPEVIPVTRDGRDEQTKQGKESAPKNGHESEEEENDNATSYLKSINMASIGVAAVIVPVIQRLSRGPSKLQGEE